MDDKVVHECLLLSKISQISSINVIKRNWWSTMDMNYFCCFLFGIFHHHLLAVIQCVVVVAALTMLVSKNGVCFRLNHSQIVLNTNWMWYIDCCLSCTIFDIIILANPICDCPSETFKLLKKHNKETSNLKFRARKKQTCNRKYIKHNYNCRAR